MTQWIFSASVLILIVLALRAVFRGKIAPWLQYALWGLVLVRLLVPFQLGQSRISVANALPTTIQSVGRDQRVPPEAPTPTEVPFQTEALPTGGTHGSRPATAEPQTPVQAPTATAAHTGAALRGVWITGTALVLLALLWSNLSFYGKLRRSRKRMECGLPLTVCAVEALPTPCLFGLLRPAVYVPAAYVWDTRAMDHILAHEYAHYRQGDHIWSLLRSLCVALHWFNPLVWLAAVLSKRDGELACDAKAIRTLGETERLSYGRTLLTLITAKPRPADLLSCATTMTSGKRALQSRVKAIARKQKMLTIPTICVLLVAVIAVGCTFTGPKDTGERGLDAYWDTTASVDGGFVIQPLSSVWTPMLTQAQLPQVLELLSHMALTDTSNEPDFVSQLYVSLHSGEQTVLSFFIDKKGEITIYEGETPYYYMCENGEDVYKQLETMMHHVQYLGEHASSYYTPPEEEQAAADFYAAMTFDRSRDYFLLPEGDYEGWSFRLDGRQQMDGDSYMSFHREFTYGDSLAGGVRAWQLPMDSFSDLSLTIIIPSDIGGTPYVSDAFDLKTLADQSDLSLPDGCPG